MKKREIKQGEIYFCNLDGDTIDNEMMGTHPVLIASLGLRNDTSPNVFVFPITHSANKKIQPTHYILYKSKYPEFSYEKNTVLCEDGRSISRKRLERFVLKIDDEDFQNILKCKEYVFKEFDFSC
jgi:mRNA-degrading endonuclease toxin of MazEF toxin-antitoxin module